MLIAKSSLAENVKKMSNIPAMQNRCVSKALRRSLFFGDQERFVIASLVAILYFQAKQFILLRCFDQINHIIDRRLNLINLA